MKGAAWAQTGGFVAQMAGARKRKTIGKRNYTSKTRTESRPRGGGKDLIDPGERGAVSLQNRKKGERKKRSVARGRLLTRREKIGLNCRVPRITSAQNSYSDKLQKSGRGTGAKDRPGVKSIWGSGISPSEDVRRGWERRRGAEIGEQTWEKTGLGEGPRRGGGYERRGLQLSCKVRLLRMLAARDFSLGSLIPGKCRNRGEGQRMMSAGRGGSLGLGATGIEHLGERGILVTERGKTQAEAGGKFGNHLSSSGLPCCFRKRKAWTLVCIRGQGGKNTCIVPRKSPDEAEETGRWGGRGYIVPNFPMRMRKDFGTVGQMGQTILGKEQVMGKKGPWRDRDLSRRGGELRGGKKGQRGVNPELAKKEAGGGRC